MREIKKSQYRVHVLTLLLASGTFVERVGVGGCVNLRHLEVAPAADMHQAVRRQRLTAQIARHFHRNGTLKRKWFSEIDFIMKFRPHPT